MDNDFIKPNNNKPEPPKVSTPETVTMPDKPSPVVGPKRKRSKKPLLVILIILLLLAAAGGAWYYRDLQAQAEAKDQQVEIDKLEKKIDQLEAAQKQEQEEPAETTEPIETDNTAAITQAFNTKTWTSLDQYMLETVSVTLPATECCGDVAKSAAIDQLESSLAAAETPWDFGLSADVIAGYQDGDYASHFPTGAMVGRTADGQVVSMVLDSEGKIAKLFIAFSDELL